MSQSINKIVKLRIRLNDESWTSIIQCLVVDSITSPLPASDIDVSDWNIPKHLRLADPQFNIFKEIGILLSSDILFMYCVVEKFLQDTANCRSSSIVN